MPLNPIQYHETVDIRFSDLDMYGHVNSKHYLDIVSTARLKYLKDSIKLPIEDITKRGIGFFLTKSTINYKKPINGLQRVFVNSFVREVRENKILVIPFTISDLDENKVFSTGELEFALIDLETKRAIIAPEWIMNIFFEKE